MEGLKGMKGFCVAKGCVCFLCCNAMRSPMRSRKGSRKGSRIVVVVRDEQQTNPPKSRDMEGMEGLKRMPIDISKKPEVLSNPRVRASQGSAARRRPGPMDAWHVGPDSVASVAWTRSEPERVFMQSCDLGIRMRIEIRIQMKRACERTVVIFCDAKVFSEIGPFIPQIFILTPFFFFLTPCVFVSSLAIRPL